MQLPGLDIASLESLMLAKLTEAVQASVNNRGEVCISPILGRKLKAHARQMSSDISAQVVQRFHECCEQLEGLVYGQSAEHSCLLVKGATALEAAGIDSACLGGG